MVFQAPLWQWTSDGLLWNHQKPLFTNTERDDNDEEDDGWGRRWQLLMWWWIILHDILSYYGLALFHCVVVSRTGLRPLLLCRFRVLFCLPSIDCSVRLHVYLNIYWLRHWKIIAATALVKYNTNTTSTGRCVISGGRTDLERDKQSANVALLCTQMLWSEKGQIGKHLMVKEMNVCVVSSKMGHLISNES